MGHFRAARKANRVVLGLLTAALLPVSLHGAETGLAEFPLGNRLMLASTTVRVEPEREARITAPAGGILQLMVAVREGAAEADTVIGVMDQSRLDLEERLLELETGHAEKREVAEWRLEQQTRKATLQERLTSLERQRDLIGRIQGDPEIVQLYLGEGAEAKEESAETFAQRQERLTDDIDLIRSVLANLEDEDLEARHFEIERIKRRQRELDLERRRSLSTVRMPFDGRYRLLFPLVEGQSEYPVEAGQEIVVFQDTRRFYAATPVQSAGWREHPKERLVLEIPRGGANGRSPEARFHSEREVFTQGQPDLLYVFRFPEANAGSLGNLMGGVVPAVVWLELGATGRIVPKVHLAVNYPDVFRAKTWADGVREVFPKAERVVAGATHVAVFPRK